jgi:dolichyl-phosphate-mannose--protein O-mannosyl transferase
MMVSASVIHVPDRRCADDVRTDYSWVTCGSVIKLRHVATNTRLHSHEVSYGNRQAPTFVCAINRTDLLCSGSGQQSVTGVVHLDDRNSLWMVQGSDTFVCSAGYADKLRVR